MCSLIKRSVTAELISFLRVIHKAEKETTRGQEQEERKEEGEREEKLLSKKRWKQGHLLHLAYLKDCLTLPSSSAILRHLLGTTLCLFAEQQHRLPLLLL